MKIQTAEVEVRWKSGGIHLKHRKSRFANENPKRQLKIQNVQGGSQVEVRWKSGGSRVEVGWGDENPNSRSKIQKNKSSKTKINPKSKFGNTRKVFFETSPGNMCKVQIDEVIRVRGGPNGL